MPAPANLVHQTTTTTGTGNLTLSAANGKQSFNTAFGNGATTNVFDYFVSHQAAAEYERGTGHMSDATTLVRDTVIESSNANAAVNFSAGTKDVVNDVPAARQFRAYEAQTWTATEQAQGRTNINAASFSAQVDNNAAINGAVDVSQELGTTGATLVTNTNKYIADSWESMYKCATGTVTSAQLAAASFGAVLAGFSFALQMKATTKLSAQGSQSDADFARIRQQIEGYLIAHWGWGATGALSIVIAAQIYSTNAGTTFIKLSNSDQSRCYYHEITLAAGWNFVTFTVAGDTTGTWQATTSAGLIVDVHAAGKNTTPASSLDAWGSTNKIATTNSTSLLSTTNNDQVCVTGLWVGPGTQLPIAVDLPALMRPFSSELFNSKRYYEKFGTGAANEAFAIINVQSTTYGEAPWWFGNEKRVAPTMSSTGTFKLTAPGGDQTLTVLAFSPVTTKFCRVNCTVSSGLTAGYSAELYCSSGNIVADARL